MNPIARLFESVFVLVRRPYKLTVPESKVLASEFFDRKLPPEGVIPADLKGEQTERYMVRKLDVTRSDGRRIKLFYTINRRGQLGNLYVDGLNLYASDVSDEVAMTRDAFIRKAVACGTGLQCFLRAAGEALADCRRTKKTADCWMCKQITKDRRDEDCNWLN